MDKLKIVSLFCCILTCCYPTAESCPKLQNLIPFLCKDTSRILAAIATTAIEGYTLILRKRLYGSLGIAILKNIYIEMRAGNMTLCMLCRSTDIQHNI